MKTTQHEKLIFNIEELVHKYSINQQHSDYPPLSPSSSVSPDSGRFHLIHGNPELLSKRGRLPGLLGDFRYPLSHGQFRMNNLIPGGCFQTVMVNWITRRENSDMKYPPEIKPVTFSAVRQDPYPPIQWTLPPQKIRETQKWKPGFVYFQNPYFTVMEINLQVCMVWLSSVLRTITEFYGWLPPSLFENGSMANNEDRI